MARAIDKDYLLKHKRKVRFFGIGPDDESWGYAVPAEIIENAPTLTPPNEWVSVEERLPRSQEDVLVVAFWHERWQTMVGWHSDMGRKWRVITPHGEREPGDVTHWMPLPPPPDKDNNVPIKAPNAPMLERAIREYLEICGNDCAGDPSVGIPECPFYQYADVLDNGALIQPKCELAAYRRPPEGET